MNILIIGNGMAAYTAAAALIKSGLTDITIVSEENRDAYYRTRIMEVVSSTVSESALTAMPLLPCTVLKGVKAVSINRADKSVILSDGSSLSYDKLILANGSEARRLSVPGSDDHVTAIRYLDDALKVRDRIKTATSIAVIGGGLLGLEAAAVLSKASSKKVNVIEGAPYLLSRQLDRASGEYLQNRLEKMNLSFITNAELREYTSNELILKDERHIPAQFVVESIGVVPNIELAKSAGLEVSRGVVVDDQLRTNDEDIYAIGDVAEYDGKVPGLMMVALQMGRMVADILSGKSVSYQVLPPSSMLKVAGLDVLSFGYVNAKDSYSIVKESEDARLCGFIKDDIFIGGTIIGKSDKVSLFRSSIGSEFNSALRGKLGL